MRKIPFLIAFSLLLTLTTAAASETTSLERCLVLKSLIGDLSTGRSTAPNSYAPLSSENSEATLRGLTVSDIRTKLWSAYNGEKCNSIFAKVLDDPDLSLMIGLSEGQ